jgi:two-component system KDP operon response regulator KdpE
MTHEPLILIVDDERPMRRYLVTLLDGSGFRTLEAGTGREGLTLAASHRPDLVLLDLGLPDVDGLEVVRSLREWTEVPIIVVSAREQERDKVQALDAGADDYLTKPFGSEELQARLRAILRRREREQSPDVPVFVCGPLRVDRNTQEVFVDDTRVELTPTEYRILTFLVKHQGRVVTLKQILDEVWGKGHVQVDHYVRVHMANLRRKIEHDPARPQLIHTEVGVGYRFRAPPPTKT